MNDDTDRAIDELQTAIGYFVALMLAIILAAIALSGCDVNTKVRPFFWPKEKPPEQVQPAPPAPKPAPPPDDLAPPWFHRPKPER